MLAIVSGTMKKTPMIRWKVAGRLDGASPGMFSQSTKPGKAAARVITAPKIRHQNPMRHQKPSIWPKPQ
jgi:hypothetical protein